MNENFDRYVCEFQPSLLQEIQEYFGNIVNKYKGISPLYYAAEFISKYYNIDDLKSAFESLKQGESRSREEEVISKQSKMTDRERIYKHIYEEVYKGYIRCPYCGNNRVPLTSHICTVCGAGLA